MIHRPLVLMAALALTLSLTAVVSAEDSNSKSGSDDRRGGLTELNEGKSASRSADSIAKFKAGADKLIDKRIDELTKLITRINAAGRLSADDKAAIIADLNTTIAGLRTLKSKIGSDTVIDTLKADIRSIFEKFRVFAVVMPRAEGLSGINKIKTVLGKLQAAGDRVSKLIDKAVAGGADTAKISLLFTDYQTKLADAKVQLDAATVKFNAMKVNDPTAAKTLFQDGKALLKKAKEDLRAAHKDLKEIIALLRSEREKEATRSGRPASSSGTTH